LTKSFHKKPKTSRKVKKVAKLPKTARERLAEHRGNYSKNKVNRNIHITRNSKLNKHKDYSKIDPDEVLFKTNSSTGQEAVNALTKGRIPHFNPF
jgi:hypothetical protein